METAMIRAYIGMALLSLSFTGGAQQPPLAAQVPHEAVRTDRARGTDERNSDLILKQQALLQKQTDAINDLAEKLKALEKRVKTLEENRDNTNGQR
jgi:flagellar motility protein MotE (MotC chaperone)